MRTTLLTLSLAAALTLAGCGASGPSKAEYIKQADAVCTKAGEDLSKKQGEAIAKLGADAKPEDLTKLISDVLIPNAEGQLAELRKLEKPSDDADTIDGIYSDLEAGLKKVEADPEALTNDPNGPLASANKKARAYGMKVCGGGS